MSAVLRNLLQAVTPAKALWATNDPLSDEQRAEVLSKLRALENKFLQFSGETFDHYQSKGKEGVVVPLPARGCYDAILRHIALLSCVRTVPREVWQEVFVWVMRHTLEFEERLGDTWHWTLRDIRSVSRLWNAAALAHFELWRVLPRMEFWGRPLRRKTHAALNRRLRVYLQRSGTLPVSFHYKAVDALRDEGAQSFETLGLLVDASARWEKVILRVPPMTLGFLEDSGIGDRGRLDSLKRLELFFVTPDFLKEGCTEISIDLFRHARMLKHVVFNGLYRSSVTEQVVLKMELPWGQLETFESRTNRDWGYHKLLESSDAKITTLKYASRKINSLPSSHPVIFQHLSQLHLDISFDLRATAYLEHLDTLILPGLEDLKIRGCFDASDPLYPTVIALVRRSGCDLKQLALYEKVKGCFQDLVELSAICQNVWYLDVNVWDMDQLRALTLDINSPCPLFPQLEILTLRDPSEWRWDSRIRKIVDPTTFMRMVQSRTEALVGIGGESDKGVVLKRLKEVRFIYRWDAEGLQSQVKAFEEADPSLAPFAVANPKIVKVLQTLTELVSSLGRWEYVRNLWAWHVKFSRRMHNALCALEELDLEREDSRVLVRLGLLHMLHQISTGSRTVPAGQAMFGIRKRTKELCNKWKPFLLRDSRSTPYRWYYVAKDMAKLKCITPSDGQDEDSEETWRDILGCSHSSPPMSLEWPWGCTF